MKKNELKLLVATLLLAVASAAPAATITQTDSFNLSDNASGSGQIILADANGLSTTFSPFNPALGTLQSFLIEWDLLLNVAGLTGGAGGGFGLGIGGNFFVNNTVYNGAGDSGSSGGPPNTAIADSGTVMNSINFLVTNAGVTYDPNILAIVTGMSDFTLTYRDSLNTIYTNFSGMANITATLTGDVAITYNYTPTVPAPASSLLLLLGLGLIGRQRRWRNC